MIVAASLRMVSSLVQDEVFQTRAYITEGLELWQVAQDNRGPTVFGLDPGLVPTFLLATNNLLTCLLLYQFHKSQNTIERDTGSCRTVTVGDIIKGNKLRSIIQPLFKALVLSLVKFILSYRRN